ncbi:chemotaxis protein CheX [Burkholderia glumae]|uniref:chemotaxis protein CheX n=1 Tax=Burkholderia glumae TaxID=337 RepID=UPI00146448B8|nr:chemotaxis protein CheX [Burkholderia glumae]QJP72580.1 chemotaxis protein CheX [Burkholderia glumae]
MTTHDTPVSKVLVLDDSATHLDAIRQFCDEHNLIGLKARRNRLLKVLRSNIDLGAVLLAFDYGGSTDEAAAVAAQIDALRPELPIIVRRPDGSAADGLPEALRRVACASYALPDLAPLRRAVDEYLFSLAYPNALVRGIEEITEARLATIFRGMTIGCETPCIVRDQIIYGEVFSLIALESAWCRGYMMMQTDEQPMLDFVAAMHPDERAPDFRDLNGVLGELTNLVWGAFKDRFLGSSQIPAASSVQVPLLVNHKHKYISFGSENPQLCFKYRVTDDKSGRTVTLHQRFVFSLQWSPESFDDHAQAVGDMVDAGELDWF